MIKLPPLPTTMYVALRTKSMWGSNSSVPYIKSFLIEGSSVSATIHKSKISTKEYVNQFYQSRKQEERQGGEMDR